ncbi:MAG: hypothetical protein KAU95_04220 [Candidatus Aenigmarchaeota archaeon]|nr:hypothetical protein [Candidatus Aenigmarchaeota archaeon]
MKKGSVDIWAWIIGGIIAGLLIFVMAYSQLLQVSESMAEQRSMEQYNELLSRINELCWSFSGNIIEYSIVLDENAKGIYLAHDKHAEINSTELINKIVDEEISSGGYLCIKIGERRVKCGKLDCESKMPYIGSVPTEFSLSALISKAAGNHEKFIYDLKLEKSGSAVNIAKIITAREK